MGSETVRTAKSGLGLLIGRTLTTQRIMEMKVIQKYEADSAALPRTILSTRSLSARGVLASQRRRVDS